ncbi:MAG: sulfite exporter TauE/SafE family protein, partial [Eggerthellaceae bacterium]|nr:sulfite exporter TauE/SafE family protein [Eggerthellaceae bacterium]
MNYLVTFLEGVVTFVSPCLLPMLPLYVAYFAGDAAGAGARTRRTVMCALGFIVGFTLLFTLLGALAGTIGSLLVQWQAALNVACGLVVVALGLNYLGVLRIPVLGRTLKPSAEVMPRNFATSLLFGMVFAVGWTPCVGAFLGSALSLAASSGDALTGVALLLCYSLGLGLPFFIAAILIDQLEGAFSWEKAHSRVIDRVCGVLLEASGLLRVTGLLG